MGRKLTKPRPKQGARLAELRKAAGLSQYQLADRIAEPQANIAFWERSAKPPRSDALPKLAQALNVSIEDLVTSGDVHLIIKRKGGPQGKLKKTFDLISKLPRSQQSKILQIIDLFLSQLKSSKSSKSK